MVTDRPSGLERTVFQRRSSGDGSDNSSLSYEDMNAQLAAVQNFLFLLAGPTASGKTTTQKDMKLLGSIEEVKIDQTREIRDVLDVGRVQVTKKEFRERCAAGRYLVTNTTDYPDEHGKREYVSYGIPKVPFLENLLSQDAVLTMTDKEFYKSFKKIMRKRLGNQRTIPIAIITDDKEDLQMRLDARFCSDSERMRRLLQVEPQWDFYASRICQGDFPHIIVNNSPKSLREFQGERLTPSIQTETYAAINLTLKKATEIVKFYRELRNNSMSAMQHNNSVPFDVNKAFLDHISFKFFGCCYDKVVKACGEGTYLKLNKSGERLTEIKQRTKNYTLVDHLFEHMTVSKAEANSQTGIVSIEFNDVISGAPQEDIKEIFRCMVPDYGRIIGDKIRYSLSDKPSFVRKDYICAIEMKIY